MFLPLLLAKLRWGEAVLGFEAAGEGGADTEAGGSGDVGDAHVGTADEQSAGMIEATVVDKVADAGVFAALREYSAGLVLRKVESLDDALTAKAWVGVEL